MFWWRKSESDKGNRLQQFMHVEVDPNTDEVAIYRREDNSCLSLSMHELAQLFERHKGRIAHPLTPRSEKEWMTRESELALIGACQLKRRFNIEMDPVFTPAPEPIVKLTGKPAQYYAGLMQRLTSAKPGL